MCGASRECTYFTLCCRRVSLRELFALSELLACDFQAEVVLKDAWVFATRDAGAGYASGRIQLGATQVPTSASQLKHIVAEWRCVHGKNLRQLWAKYSNLGGIRSKKVVSK